MSRRLLQAVPVILIVMVSNFLLLRLAPGDAVDVLLATTGGGGDAQMVADLRQRYGLNQPEPVQLGLYLWRLAQFDLGFSPTFNEPVLGLILSRLGSTLLLMMASLAFAFGLGVLLGVTAALRAGGWRDRVIVVFSLIAYAMPGFWIGLMLIVVFSVRLGWLPLGGMETIASPLTGLARLLDIARHLIMPTLMLSLLYLALYTRLMRTGMLATAGQDYIRTARAKGLSRRRIVWRHQARNALLPMVTMLGVQFGALLGGSVVGESVFAIPGVGRLAFESVMNRDFNTLLGIIFMSALLVTAVNLLVDLVYAWLDPRVTVGGTR